MLPLVQRSQFNLPQYDLRELSTRYFNPGELEILIALISSVNPRNVLEFGCNEGRTAKAILRNLLTVERYVGVDVYASYRPKLLPAQRNEIPATPGGLVRDNVRFELILKQNGSFDLTVWELQQHSPKFDAIFIDGDHSREGVINDTMLADAVINPNDGIIIWHDYHEQGTVGVKAVLDEMYGRGRSIKHVENTWIAFEAGREDRRK